MTIYKATGPISTTIQLVAGDVRIDAGDGADLVVDVTPSNESHVPDVSAADQTRVDYANGTLRVIGPRGHGAAFLRKPGSVQVVVTLPSGSGVEATTGLGRIVATGRLGDCHMRSGAGDVQLGDAGAIDLVTGIGAVSAGHVSGSANCVTGSGSVRVARVDGGALVKNSNGDTWIGEAGGAVRVKSSNGGVVIDRARGDVKAATANGDLRIGSAAQGTVELKTALGRIEVGIAPGTAARLDVHTSFGTVISELDPAERPQSDEATVTLSAQTSAGDIVIRRASVDGSIMSIRS